jgi:hypothetical protein
VPSKKETKIFSALWNTNQDFVLGCRTWTISQSNMAVLFTDDRTQNAGKGLMQH